MILISIIPTSFVINLSDIHKVLLIYNLLSCLFQMPEFPPMQPIPPIKPIPPMEPILFVKPLAPINFDKIKKAKPGENENIQIMASSSHSQYSDVDGVQNSSGGSNTMVNINGNVRQEIVDYNNKPVGEEPRGGNKRPEDSKVPKGTKLGKHSKSSKAAKPNDTNLHVKPTENLNTNVVQNK